ncbi:hypothetical protein [Phytoactinopolyspora halotolerans]|uniref:DUF4367 domain-containing protein n=1 Tax=Phytoactinopolyspora halotolerans TaxID=1981512 RepID=A0A6L9SDN5_9ACTN|nr:hypothetical protein [Phytoactinopolyspora halotolerans]NEE02658.1 hypothetical protein [Phytoactinopolyspora halotolerans]
MDDDRFETELRALGEELAVPEVDAEVTATAVLERIAATEAATGRVAAAGTAPTTGTAPAAGRVRRFPAWAQTIAGKIRTRWRTVIAAVVAVLVAGALTPPVRATVADWLGLGGLDVRPGPAVPSAPPPPAVDGDLDVDGAAELVDFAPAVPDLLGDPDAVEVSPSRQRLSMSWSRPHGTIRLDQFTGSLAVKFAPDPGHPVDLGPARGLWFADPHDLHLYDAEGTEAPIVDRASGPSLVWQVGATTVRLEGIADAERAAEIARSTLDAGT